MRRVVLRYKQLDREITLSESSNITYCLRVQYSAPEGKLLSMDNENRCSAPKMNRQHIPSFGLGLRLYVIDHHTTSQRFKKKSIGVGWGKFYEHGVEEGPCVKRGKGHLSSFVVCRISACLRADVSYFLCCTWKRKKR